MSAEFDSPAPGRPGRRPAAALAAVLGLAAFVTACSTPGEPVESGPAAAHPRVEVRFTPSDLDDELAVENIAVREVDALMEAAVQLRNPESDDAALQYQTWWEDADGFQVEEPSLWQRLSLASGETELLSTSAPAPGAERLILQIREVR